MLSLNLMLVNLHLIDSCSQKVHVRADVILTLTKYMCHDTIHGWLVLYVLVIYCWFL